MQRNMQRLEYFFLFPNPLNYKSRHINKPNKYYTQTVNPKAMKYFIERKSLQILQNVSIYKT